MTEERLARLEERVDNGFTEVRQDIAELKDLFKSLPQQFAPKYVERALWAISGIVLTGLATLGAMVASNLLSHTK